MEKQWSYDKESLKVNITSTQQETQKKEFERLETLKTIKEEETMSNRKAVAVVAMLFVMYAIVSALPTFLLMHFFHLSFLLSQGIVLIGMVLVVWVFGLYKPASNEQKLKSKYLL